jgi:predicted regulator of Ras-like GTPase activity (Roadblock/LC7/MglB family)
VPVVDASEALEELAEISRQIELAVLLEPDGSVAATPEVDRERALAVAAAARELLAACEQSMGGEEAREQIVQLHVATRNGFVFVVRDEDRVAAAVTGTAATVGLIFYDLKTCLRHVAGESLAPKPRARPGSRAGNGEG